MNGIYEWVRNITYYLIFITVVTNILPNKKYEKYLKLFAGMVLILIVLKPVTGGLKLDDKLAYYFESISFQKESDDLKKQLLGVEEKRLETMIGQYETAVAADLEGMAENYGFYKKEITVRIESDQNQENFGRVRSVFLILTQEEPDSRESGSLYQVEPVEKVRVETKFPAVQEKSRDERQADHVKLNSLKEKIEEYYGLDSENVQIQLENE